MTESTKVLGISTNEAIEYLNYNGPVHLTLRPLTPEAIEIWERKMKLVNFK